MCIYYLFLGREKKDWNANYWLIANLVPSNSQNIPKFPKVRPHAPNTIQTPRRESLDFTGRLKQSLWTFLARVWEPDIKYAIRTGLAAAILAFPAFFEATRPLFVEYRGEWALLSVITRIVILYSKNINHSFFLFLFSDLFSFSL